MNDWTEFLRTAVSGLVVTALFSAVGIGTASAETEPPDETRRFALVVANNHSVDADVESLEFADDDGARYYEMFRSFTGDATLLTNFDSESRRIFPDVAKEASPPTRRELGRAVERLAARIDEARERGAETELYLVFTGHGNVDDDGSGYLSLADSKLRRAELYRNVLRPLGADYTHLVVDACHAYHMVHARGGGDDWEDDRSGETLDRELAAYLADDAENPRETRRSVGVIVSTAGTAEVHEWSRYRAGVFSHQLRSGLLGAADADGDGDVTYRELEAYLAAANAAVTNPKARIEVYAHPPERSPSRPVVSVGGFENATILEVPSGASGRYHLDDARGLRYADFHTAGSASTRIALLRAPLEDERYYLHREDSRAEIPLDSGAVNSSKLAFREASNRTRGSVDEAFRNNLFETPYGPSFVAGYRAGRDSRPDRRTQGSTGEQPENWNLETSAAYGVAPGIGELYVGAPSSPIEHHFDLRAVFRHQSGWGVGPFVSYGIWSPDSDVGLHRFSGGVEVSHRLTAGPQLAAVPALRVGHAGYLQTGHKLRSDPLGFRAEASVGLGWTFADRYRISVEPGVAASIYTIDASDGSNTEKLFVSPMARVGFTF